MCGGYARLLERRARQWLEALERLREASRRLRARLGRLTLILYGSYARGDFNLWSDIDIIIVSDAFHGIRPLDRYDIVAPALEPGMEPITLTSGEAGEVLRRPGWRAALRDAVIVVDDYGLKTLIEEVSGVRPRRLEDLVERLRRLPRGVGREGVAGKGSGEG
ncbi:MAG: nucleotidyltransferase domain-containing protein [Crenarchaeota archaeon]|nr:nucleotidyltransferase domain-containing protein [Thermoproteota archaeon]